MYFCCLEALQNVAKHAPQATVAITVADGPAGMLTFVVRDDGPGFEPTTVRAGHGLQNMADRVGAVGGTLAVDAAPGTGTTVTGHAAAMSARVSTSWGAVGTVARHELRRRGVALVLLGLAAGLLGAVVIGALATARRTATAYERLEQASAIDDVRALVFGDPALATDVGRRCRASRRRGRRRWPSAGSTVRAPSYTALLTGPPPPAGLFTPVVVAGRLPAADAPEEVLVVEAYADDVRPGAGRHGSRSTSSRADEVAQFDTGFGEPDGPTIDLVVSGITRLPGARQSPIVAGPAFFERYGDERDGGPHGAPAPRRGPAADADAAGRGRRHARRSSRPRPAPRSSCRCSCRRRRPSSRRTRRRRGSWWPGRSCSPSGWRSPGWWPSGRRSGGTTPGGPATNRSSRRWG